LEKWYLENQLIPTNAADMWAKSNLLLAVFFLHFQMLMQNINHQRHNVNLLYIIHTVKPHFYYSSRIEYQVYPPMSAKLLCLNVKNELFSDRIETVRS
jgi:uncharacterized membrane protein